MSGPTGSVIWFSERKMIILAVFMTMTLPYWGDAKVVEEPHRLPTSLLDRVPKNTTAPTAEDVPVPLPTLDEIVATQPDPRLTKKSKGSVKWKAPSSSVVPSEPSQPPKIKRLKKKASEAGSSASAVEQTKGLFLLPRLGKIIGSLPRLPVVASSDPSHVGTSDVARASSSGYGLVQNGHMPAIGKLPLLGGGFVIVIRILDGCYCASYSSGAMDEICYEELGLGHARGQLDLLDTLARSALSRDEDYDQIPDDDFATASVGNSSPEYTRQQWDGPHASEDNILCSEIFKGLDVCRRALDRTITSAELKIIESLLPLEPSNRFNVLSALLCITELRAEVSSLEEKYDKVQEDCSALYKESRELRSRNDALSKELKRLKVQLADAESTAARSADELARTDAKLSDQALVVIGLQDELAHERSKS
ncbi:hypothetical protein Tco_0540371 [Tanacetum coccineum]